MSCSHVNSCELFVQFAMNPALELWKVKYCEGNDFARCARYKASLTGLPVPLTLLPNGRKISAKDDSDEIGASSLFNAIIKRQTHMIASLLRVGVNINVKNIEGITPLMAAAQFGAEDIAKLLLEHGAKPFDVNQEGETAYDIAIRNGHDSIARLINPAANIRNKNPQQNNLHQNK